MLLSILLLALYTFLAVFTTARLILGPPFQPLFTPVLTLLAFGFALTHGSQRLGWRWALALLAITFAVSLALESVGVATGLVYGPYHYTAKLGPKFLGLVPLAAARCGSAGIAPAFLAAKCTNGADVRTTIGSTTLPGMR